MEAIKRDEQPSDQSGAHSDSARVDRCGSLWELRHNSACYELHSSLDPSPDILHSSLTLSTPSPATSEQHPHTNTLNENNHTRLENHHTLPTPSSYTNHANTKHQLCLDEMETDRGRQIQTSIAEAIPALVRLILYFGGMSLGMVFIAAVTDFINARTPRAVMCAILVILFCLGYWMTMTTLNGLVRSGSAHYVLMICGSGGHTAEMIGMIERSIRPEDSSHRRWAVGIGDEMSFGKVMAFERRLMQRFSHLELDSGTFDIVWFERARVVHQSWLTTPFTAVLSMIGIFRILITPAHRRPASAFRFPGVIVTNGPGTGFLFLLAARVLKTFHVVPKSHMKTIFVESWARIKTLSLTGKLIHRCKLADVFIVQSRGLTAYGIFAENMPAMPVVPQFALDQQ